MKTLSTILLLGIVSSGWCAPNATPPATLRSVSGQFIVHDLRGPVTALNLTPGKPVANTMELAPSFLVVSCERIKQALATELAAGGEWRDTIHVAIRPERRGNNTPQIKIERFGSRWLYKVDFPERIDRTQFFRTLIQVLLLEQANRGAGEHSAEIPLWLSEGLTQRLLASREVELVLPSPTLSIGTMLVDPQMFQVRDPDPLARARQVLQKRQPPALAELSWPALENFSPEDAEYFQVSAQLFVAELLQLKNGKEELRRFVASLPRYFNWQTAFTQSYAAVFPNQLALEKWWALQAAHFIGRDNRQLWTPEESAQKLDEILRVSIAVRAQAGELPARTDVSLQTVLREWDTIKQMQTVQDKLRELRLAMMRITPTYLVLVNDYQLVLAEFVKQRSRSASTFGWMLLPPSAKEASRIAIQKLDMLDVRRQQLALTNAITATPPATGWPAPKR